MNIFLTGATGYIGRHLLPVLLERGHTVRALVRRGSEKKLAAGAQRPARRSSTSSISPSLSPRR